jgi:glutamyl-tRNA synthetase, bacterial family
MTITVRFAPSPTGLLHVGNTRTALINWLFARAHGGRFLLRFDDTDTGRSREEYVTGIERDLSWLGLAWSHTLRQSLRLARYHEALARLQEAGRIYSCYETPEELNYKRWRQISAGKPPIYDRAGLALTPSDRQALEAEGRRPHWRFLLTGDAVAWDDLVRGPVQMQADHMSDPIVIRADGSFLFLLPSMVDDIELGVTHVIRGEDHVSNTAVQIQICRALGAEPPAFAHLPLMTDMSGKGLSKRLGSLNLGALAEEGIEPMAVSSYLANLGTGEPLTLFPSLDALAENFDLTRYGRGTPKFDEAQLRMLNHRLIHESPFPAVRRQLDAMGLDRADARFWEAIRPNLTRLSEARYWHDVCFGAIEPVVPDPRFLDEAATLLPAEPWGSETWETWTTALKGATGRKGKALFQPLRLALTGVDHGPELKALLPLIGRPTVERRLRGERS